MHMKPADATKLSANAPEQQDEALSATELRDIGSAIARDFPLTAGHPDLVLMDVDPLHLHVYWDQDPAGIESALNYLTGTGGSAHLVLRFRDIPDSHAAAGVSKAVTAFDREIHVPAGHELVRVPSAGHCYEVELGVTAEDGGWRMLARSNRVCMPPIGPTPETAVQTLNLAGTDLPRVSGDAQEPLTLTDELTESQDLSLSPGGMDRLEQDFPNRMPMREPVREAATASAEMAVLPDVPVHLPGPEKDDYAGLPGRLQPGSASLSSSSLAAMQVQAGLHLQEWGSSNMAIGLNSSRFMLKKDGGFGLLNGVEPDNPCVAMLLGSANKKPGI